MGAGWDLIARRRVRREVADIEHRPHCRAAEARARSAKFYSGAMPFSASSFFAFSFLAKCVSPMPRSTLGAFVN